MDGHQAQRLVNEQVERHVPDVWDTVVAIVLAHNQAVHQIGTGTLLKIADVGFVVTAAHVIRGPYEHGKTIGVSNAAEGFAATPGIWMTSAELQQGREDPFDLAIYRIPAERMERFSGMRFLRLDDVYFGPLSPTAVLTLYGFPGIWGKTSRNQTERLIVKPWFYTTYRYQGSVETLLNYRPEHHVLLNAIAEQSTLPDGSRVALAHPDGRSATFPRDLKGISGCSIWRIGDLATPIGQWGNMSPGLVAVQTGVYQESQVIRGTHWVCVTTLLWEAFPDLRPAMDLVRSERP